MIPNGIFAVLDAVRCRICNQALSLDDCTRSVECSPDEVRAIQVVGRAELQSLGDLAI